jgi:hypothetical protein
MSSTAAPASAWDDDSSTSGRAILWILAVLGVALLLGLGAWLLGFFGAATDPRVLEARTLQAEAQKLYTANGGPTTMQEAEAAVAAMQAVREKVEALPEPLRMQVGRGSGFRAAMQARVTAYFALPADKRQAELDRQIAQEDMMRKAFEKANPNGWGGPPGGGPPGGGPPGGGGQGQAGGGQQAGGPGGGGGGPGGGPPRGGSQDDQNRWRKGMIDSTSPQQRTQYAEYRRAMDARREQLGKPSPWGR